MAQARGVPRAPTCAPHPPSCVCLRALEGSVWSQGRANRWGGNTLRRPCMFVHAQGALISRALQLLQLASHSLPCNPRTRTSGCAHSHACPRINPDNGAGCCQCWWAHVRLKAAHRLPAAGRRGWGGARRTSRVRKQAPWCPWHWPGLEATSMQGSGAQEGAATVPTQTHTCARLRADLHTHPNCEYAPIKASAALLCAAALPSACLPACGGARHQPASTDSPACPPLPLTLPPLPPLPRAGAARPLHASVTPAPRSLPRSTVSLAFESAADSPPALPAALPPPPPRLPAAVALAAPLLAGRRTRRGGGGGGSGNSHAPPLRPAFPRPSRPRALLP